MTEQTMIERMAVALDAEIGRQWKEKPMLNVTDLARAVLAVMREPTKPMMQVGMGQSDAWLDVWAAMIDAAFGETGARINE